MSYPDHVCQVLESITILITVWGQKEDIGIRRVLYQYI